MSRDGPWTAVLVVVFVLVLAEAARLQVALSSLYFAVRLLCDVLLAACHLQAVVKSLLGTALSYFHTTPAGLLMQRLSSDLVGPRPVTRGPSLGAQVGWHCSGGQLRGILLQLGVIVQNFYGT
jgi:hypothetical protein